MTVTGFAKNGFYSSFDVERGLGHTARGHTQAGHEASRYSDVFTCYSRVFAFKTHSFYHEAMLIERRGVRLSRSSSLSVDWGAEGEHGCYLVYNLLGAN
jgi:hypothetical protein